MIQIKIDDFTLQYDGEYSESGFMDMISMCRHLFAGAGYWSFGDENE